jgi:hypothetical protein
MVSGSGTELVKVSTASVPSVGDTTPLPVLVERAGGRHASPGMNTSKPSTTTRTRKKPKCWR